MDADEIRDRLSKRENAKALKQENKAEYTEEDILVEPEVKRRQKRK